MKEYPEKFLQGQSVIDFGCGVGRSSFFFLEKGLDVTLFDLCREALDPQVELLVQKKQVDFEIGCLWNLTIKRPFDWVFSFDVLEHLPEEKVEKSLENMAFSMKKGGYFGVALVEDQLGKKIGEKLHLCVKPVSWWKEKIRRFFLIEQTFLLGKEYALFSVYKKS